MPNELWARLRLVKDPHEEVPMYDPDGVLVIPVYEEELQEELQEESS